jgi:site-specific DNA-adenine methylase
MCRNFRKDLLPWKEKLDNLTFYKFFNLDFHDFYDMLIKIKPSLERVNYVLYADPPYFVMGKCYKHSFKEQDHIDLANYHNQLKDRSDYHILISYDDHPEIRKLYSDWYVKEINYKTSVQAKKMEEYTELLISNKPIEKYKYNVNWISGVTLILYPQEQ